MSVAVSLKLALTDDELTGSSVLMDEVLASSITVIVVNRRQGTVDGELLKVGTAVTVELSIKVRKDSSLQQRIVGEVDTANNVSRLELLKLDNWTWSVLNVSTHHNLLSLGEIVDWVRIQFHNTKRLKGNQLFGNNLGCIQNVEPKRKSLVLVKDLSIELPFGAVSRFDSVPKTLSVVIRVLSSQVLCLIPDQAGFALLGLPVELDELGVAIIRHEAECVNSKPIHVLI